MMIKQFKRGDGFGVGYTYTKSDFDRLHGKIGKTAGNIASTSTQPSLVDPADGVLKEPPKAPPQKQTRKVAGVEGIGVRPTLSVHDHVREASHL